MGDRDRLSAVTLAQHYFMRITYLELQAFIYQAMLSRCQDELDRIRAIPVPNQPAREVVHYVSEPPDVMSIG